jgi:hypothetical protein
MALVAAILGIAGCAASVRPPTAGAVAVPATQVVRYTPKRPAGEPSEGDCWTRSAAADRDDAWRCSVGSAVFDPCFALSEGAPEVVCAAEPATGATGFVVHLARPLPVEPAPAAGTPAPWRFRLADGEQCDPFTGTMPLLGDEVAHWYCFDPAAPARLGLITRLDRGAPWVASWVAHSPGAGDPKPRAIPVTDVWF